jgi:hypothetical protein
MSATTPDFVKAGTFVVLVGFLIASAATVNTPEDALRIARTLQFGQGFGWMVVGIGLCTAFLGVVRRLRNGKQA